MVVDFSISTIMASPSAFALATVGWVVRSVGSWEIERATASRTSLAAASRSRDRVKVMLMVERPSRLFDCTRSMPEMPDTWRSIGWVIRVSTTSADAPR